MFQLLSLAITTYGDRDVYITIIIINCYHHMFQNWSVPWVPLSVLQRLPQWKTINLTKIDITRMTIYISPMLHTQSSVNATSKITYAVMASVPDREVCGGSRHTELNIESSVTVGSKGPGMHRSLGTTVKCLSWLLDNLASNGTACISLKMIRFCIQQL